MFGFYKIATFSPKLTLANPNKNAKEIVSLIYDANKNESSIALFPELSIFGYSVGDLLFQNSLYKTQLKALEYIINETKDLDIISILGAALKYQDRLYNCAVVIQKGKILGVVPKSFIPNKQEFYEARYFVSGKEIKNRYINIFEKEIPFGVDLLFSDKSYLNFGIEICEDLWATTPPSNTLAEAGANLILNLSASNEIIGKSEYRLELVKTQSARLICAYVYASSGLGESGSDTIFSGDLIICEYGRVLKRDNSFSFDNKSLYTIIDLERVDNLRAIDSSFSQSKINDSRVIDLNSIIKPVNIDRFYNPHPFLPSREDMNKRAEEITNIQAYALIKRMKIANIKRAVIGISGGLDSTLALLVVYKAFKIANWDSKDIIAITMPGFGTTSRTLNNSKKLCNVLGVDFREIDIKEISLLEFKAIKHNPKDFNVTYENVQARVRTSILMNLANKHNGLVIGTGDLSEIALGWNTYNGDHMSMYAINSGIPKTLIKYLIEYFAKDNLKDILQDILNTPISPELLPNNKDKIEQITEDIIGPYELHDFFLYHFIREGFSPKKILFIASLAFKDKYSKESIKKWLKVFIKRFFTQQFKRNCTPDGVMVGTISLSPRANWRMPSDASFEIFLKELE